MNDLLYIVNDWVYIWRGCIAPTFKAIYQAMDTIVIVSMVDGSQVSLWDFCIGIVVMGAILNLFINFTLPSTADKSSFSKRHKSDKKREEG